MLRRCLSTTGARGAEVTAMRARAAAALDALPSASSSEVSWVDGRVLGAAELEADPLRASFERHGFAKLEAFASAAECAGMLARMGDLTDAWDPELENPVAFRTDGEQEGAQGASDYFSLSADRVHFFAEVDAVDDGAGASGGLRPGLAKGEALNKVGHGLHVADEVFKEYSGSPKVTALARRLGWAAPVLPQSMYIFKQPRIGGEVTSHQDSTFLYTTPRQTCLGLWLALHDATVENGCVWVRPGSHRETLRRAFVTSPDGSGNMIFEDEECEGAGGEGAAAAGRAEAWAWEGALPEGSWPPPSDGLFAAGFIPIECKAGDLLVFPGLLDHLSLPNASEAPRHTFQLHLVEGPGAGVRWSERNWLQYPGKAPFPEL